MKFLRDIPIARATIEHLNGQGHDAVRVCDRLAPTASDPEIIRIASAEGRVILCFDLDLAELVALSGERLPSVITFRTKKHPPEFINQRLDEILPKITAQLPGGMLLTVEQHPIRVRPLPAAPKPDS